MKSTQRREKRGNSCAPPAPRIKDATQSRVVCGTGGVRGDARRGGRPIGPVLWQPARGGSRRGAAAGEGRQPARFGGRQGLPASGARRARRTARARRAARARYTTALKKTMSKTAPPPGALEARTEPPWAVTRLLASARPMPTPVGSTSEPAAGPRSLSPPR